MREDTYSRSFCTALDVVVRRLGWRLSDPRLNPLAFKAREDLGLKTWGMINHPPSAAGKSLRDITELSSGGIHNQDDYNKHLDFMMSAIEFYNDSPCGHEVHPFDELIPILRDHDYQLTFYSHDVDFKALVMRDHPDNHEWRLAPKFVATQEHDLGRQLRSFGFRPNLDFLTSGRYRGHVW